MRFLSLLSLPRLIVGTHLLRNLLRNDETVEAKQYMAKTAASVVAGAYFTPIAPFAASAASKLVDYIFDTQVKRLSQFEIDKKYSSDFASLSGEILGAVFTLNEYTSLLSKAFEYSAIALTESDKHEAFKKVITKEVTSKISSNFSELFPGISEDTSTNEIVRKSILTEKDREILEKIKEVLFDKPSESIAEPLIENLSNCRGTRIQSLAYTMALSIAPKFINKMISEGYKAEDINNVIFELAVKEFTSDGLTKAFLKLLLNRYYGTILV